MKESEAASDVEERVNYIKGREYASLGRKSPVEITKNIQNILIYG